MCRHFALLAASILRAKGVPARLRVGFAFCFTSGLDEDYRVCEFHDGAQWRLFDAELGDAARARMGSDFNPADVPRIAFVPAATMWKRLRAGQADGEAIGVSTIAGMVCRRQSAP